MIPIALLKNNSKTKCCFIIFMAFVFCFVACKKSKTETQQSTPTGKEIPVSPQYLAVYYGYPSFVNGSLGNVTTATDIFRKFDIIVLGDQLWKTTHPDNSKTKQILTNLKALKPGIKIYGYIDVGNTQNLTIAQLQQAIDGWKATGATGVFGDEFGSDYGVTRARQNSFIDYAHASNLSVFVNSHWVTDALGGTDCKLVQGDYYLFESILSGNGAYNSLTAFKQKADSAYKFMIDKKVGIAAVATTTPGNASSFSDTTSRFRQAWYGTAMYNFDAFQYTDFWYSASNNILNFYTNPITNYGTFWRDAGVLQESANRFKRSSNTHTLYITGDGASVGNGGFTTP